MNKWNRVPSIYLRSLTGWWARLGWILGEVPQPGLVSEVKQKGWMVYLKGVIRHVTEWASQGFRKKEGSLDFSFPHLAPFTEHAAHSIPHSHCTWAIFALSIFTQISPRCAKNVGTWESLPLQTWMHACTYIWNSYFTLQKRVIHTAFQNANVFVSTTYLFIAPWTKDPKPLFFCSYQVDIGIKSWSLSTKKMSQKNSKCSKL